METLKRPCGEAHMKRPPTNSQHQLVSHVSEPPLEVNPLISVKPSGDYSSSQYLIEPHGKP